MEDGGNVVLPTVAFALSDSVADSVPNGSIESPAAESTPARRSSAKKTKKKKHHRHAKTWDANGRENPRRLRQSGVSAVPSTGIVEQKFLNVSREQQAEFVLSPSLLNDSSFEPRVVQAVTPKYKERTAKKGGTSASGSSSRQRAESGKSTFYAASNRRYSSMNSLHVSSVLHSPDVVEIINCFARALHGNIENSLALAPEDLKLLEIYNEMLHPMNDGPRRKMPSQEVIVDFITRIYFGIALAPENCVMALAYIERLVSLTNVSLHPVTWRRITLSALMLASKVWEDLAVHNKDILRVFPRFSMRDMLELERTFLTDLQFTVTLRASIYAKYYFELRTLSQNESTFPFQPLTNEGAAFLEARSRGAERKLADAKKERRTKSLESLLSSPQERTIGLEEFKQITNKLGAV